MDSAGNAYVVGGTSSTDFPLLRPYKVKAEVATYGAVFVTKLTETVLIGGRVASADKTGIGGVTVTLSGTQNRTTTTNAAGDYAFRNLKFGGSYSVTASKGSLTFLPARRSYSNLQVNQTKANFTTPSATISGRVRLNSVSGADLAGVTVTLAGGADFTPRTAVTASDGTYSFARLPTPRNYTITPSKTHDTFSPARTALLYVAADQPETNFVATLKTYTVSGVVRFGSAGLAGVPVYLASPDPAGFAARITKTTSTGAYSFINVPASRSYFVQPEKPGYQFTPWYSYLWDLSANQTGVNFLVEVHSVSGRVTRAGTTKGVGAVTLTLTSPTPAGFPARTTQTGSSGYYTFTNLPAGRNYTLKPAKSGFTFSPTARTILNLSGNIPAGVSTSFTGTGP